MYNSNPPLVFKYDVLLWGHSSACGSVLHLQKKDVRLIFNGGSRDYCRPFSTSCKDWLFSANTFWKVLSLSRATKTPFPPVVKCKVALCATVDLWTWLGANWVKPKNAFLTMLWESLSSHIIRAKAQCIRQKGARVAEVKSALLASVLLWSRQGGRARTHHRQVLRVRLKLYIFWRCQARISRSKTQKIVMVMTFLSSPLGFRLMPIYLPLFSVLCQPCTNLDHCLRTPLPTTSFHPTN